MPLPSYKYRPPQRPSEQPAIKTYLGIRGRLIHGGTFFRSKQVGPNQNKISVEVISFSENDGVCVIKNDNSLNSENIEGKAEASLLRINLPYSDYIELDRLHTPVPRARHYSISAQIGAAKVQVGSDLQFSFLKPLHIGRAIAVKLQPTAAAYTAEDKIIIKPRFRIYRLNTKSAFDALSGMPVTGWDIDDLRDKVNSDTSSWVEMPVRGTDAQDAGGFDAPVLMTFQPQFLAGGDGLPDVPNNEVTGHFRSLVHLNYAEGQTGALEEVNQVYEWFGSSATLGEWRIYSS